MKRRNLLLIAVSALLLSGCIVRWQGREALALDPDADIWWHHPQSGTTNQPPTL